VNTDLRAKPKVELTKNNNYDTERSIDRNEEFISLATKRLEK
jgi:hypothetical protein